ncbi:Solute carrier 26 [Kappamyces sp. JEL0829]|nr:Solute carrier 26 [Kappamyces sp. JEL0829]
MPEPNAFKAKKMTKNKVFANQLKKQMDSFYETYDDPDRKSRWTMVREWWTEQASSERWIVWDWMLLLFPILNQLRNYTLQTLSRDVKAAVTITFLTVPFAIAYPGLAQLPPVAGLVSASVPAICYGFFGTSPQLSFSPEAMVSVIVGMGVRSELLQDPGQDASDVGSKFGLLCGVLGLILAFFQTGFIADVLSGYLLLGFVLGVSHLVMIRQLPVVLGLPRMVEVETDSALNQIIQYCKLLPQTSRNTLYFSLVALALLLLLRYGKGKIEETFKIDTIIPEVLVMVLVSGLFSYALDVETRFGISTLGTIHDPIPQPKLPMTDWDFIYRNFPRAITVVLFGFFESITLVRRYGVKNNYFPSADRVLFSIGLVNIVGSIFGGYPTYASLSRSRTQASAGASTMVSGLLAGMLIMVVIVTFVESFQYIPKATLGVLVLDAAFRLVQYDELAYTLKMKNLKEVTKLVLAYGFTIFLTPSTGIIFCLVLSALVIIRRSTHINVSVLGEIEVQSGADVVPRHVDIKSHPEAFVLAQVVPLSIKGSLEYFNAARISRKVEMLTDAVSKLAQEELHGSRSADQVSKAIRNNTLFISRESRQAVTMILDFQELDDMDSSAAWQLKKIVENSRGDRIIFSGLQQRHVDMLTFMNQENIFETFDQAMEAVKLQLYADSVYSSENQASHQSLSVFRQLHPDAEETQLSVRSVRSLRSLHQLQTDWAATDANQNSVRSVRQFASQADMRLHARNIFQDAPASAPAASEPPEQTAQTQDTITIVTLE